MLGVRPGVDGEVSPEGHVRPRGGGLSVAVGSPRNLPRHRRPPEHGGIGADPVWAIETGDLTDDLDLRRHPGRSDSHALVEPSRPMPLDEFQNALAVTRSFWGRI